MKTAQNGEWNCNVVDFNRKKILDSAKSDVRCQTTDHQYTGTSEEGQLRTVVPKNYSGIAQQIATIVVPIAARNAEQLYWE